jgi:DNA repair exonuclease SbcCD ATPase subunit
MLRKVALLNTKVFGKAEITLDDCDSLQLVGPNNVGKSTLIYALNFLFVVDGQKMTFSGQRKGDKDTIHHYFPTSNQSYIIFEAYKNTSYCILVKRDNEGELEYYHFNHPYDENLFFEPENGMQKIIRWEEVKTRMSERGIELEQFRNKSEVFNMVYQRGLFNNSVVWLEDTVKSDGLSNNFSKIYRYLINSKLITNKSLKESLIIADNRENEGINFSQKNKKDITDLLRINDEIKNIKSIRNDFIKFRDIVHQYNGKTQLVREYLHAFNTAYQPVQHNLSLRGVQKTQEINSLSTELNEILKPKKDDLNKKLGNKEAEIEFELRQLSSYQQELEEIRSFETLAFLTQSADNLEKKRKEIESVITEVEKSELSVNYIEGRINILNDSIEELKNQIKNYNNLLIQKISDNPETRKLLNTILSPQVAGLPSSQIKKPVKKVSELLKIFDGEIDIAKSLKIVEFKTVEELKDELNYQKKEKQRFERLLPVAKNYEKTVKELAEIKVQMEQVKEKIRRLKTLPSLEKKTGEVDKRLSALRADKNTLESDIKKLNEEINRRETSIRQSDDEKRKIDERIKELTAQKQDLESIGLEPVAFETDEELEKIYTKIKIYQNDRLELKVQKDKSFDYLKGQLDSNIADENEFILYVEDEIACLADKENSIEGLLQSISTQFSNPAYTLIKRYEDFKQFVYNKFNKKLEQTRISNIESFKIELIDNKKVLEELKKISSIQDINGQLLFDFDQTENLKVLNHYLDTGKKVNFNELFDIELHLQIRGAVKKVDLAAQVESDGTDRMIRLVIIMTIINRLAINHENNRIALFIDEVATIDEQNRPELVKFCKEHFFIPIFAAPAAVEGFNKYYFLFPSRGKINVNDKQHVAYMERV